MTHVVAPLTMSIWLDLSHKTWEYLGKFLKIGRDSWKTAIELLDCGAATDGWTWSNKTGGFSFSPLDKPPFLPNKQATQESGTNNRWKSPWKGEFVWVPWIPWWPVSLVVVGPQNGRSTYKWGFMAGIRWDVKSANPGSWQRPAIFEQEKKHISSWLYIP